MIKKIFFLSFIKFFLILFYIKRTICLNEQLKLSYPEEFDLRIEYNECESLKLIKYQGECGGCWAFAVTGVISDRICINSRGKDQIILSETELISCCFFCFDLNNYQKGCGGGTENSAFLYWVVFGLPTSSCKPFHFEEESSFDLIKCNNTCEDGSKPIYYIGSDYRVIYNDEEEIMNEIYRYGSVTAYFEVYYDFYIYWYQKNCSGIYEFIPVYEFKGLHLIKIIGWGSEIVNGKKIKYWICANSWKTNENRDGFFKFKRGVNQCNIELTVFAGYINSKTMVRNQESLIVYEDNFFNFKTLDKDFM